MTLAVKDSAMSVQVDAFKEAMAHWASGVSVVTATSPADGRPVGITVSSLASLSIAPPQVLISVNKRLFTHDVIIGTGRFAANILRAEQKEWGMRFAGMVPEVDDRFAGIDTFCAATGCPILADALAWIDCEVRHTYDGEDHTIIVGEVIASGSAADGGPLLYYDRKWHTISQG